MEREGERPSNFEVGEGYESGRREEGKGQLRICNFELGTSNFEVGEAGGRRVGRGGEVGSLNLELRSRLEESTV